MEAQNSAGVSPTSKSTSSSGFSDAKQTTTWPTIHLDAVRYDTKTGLVPVVVQSAVDGQVLMLAYANREALKRTFGTKTAWFWSRSRNEYWQKGATSGHIQHVVDIRLDCDGDSVLYFVQPDGPACHTGEVTCFYRRMVYKDDSSNGATEVEENPLVLSSSDANHDGGDNIQERKHEDWNDDTLARLWRVISERYVRRPSGSYTTYLFEQGLDKAAKKFGEEGVEVVLAAKNADAGRGISELAEESADLLFHLLVVWKSVGLSPKDVWAVLDKRAK